MAAPVKVRNGQDFFSRRSFGKEPNDELLTLRRHIPIRAAHGSLTIKLRIGSKTELTNSKDKNHKVNLTAHPPRLICSEYAKKNVVFLA
jgi:hypothetical protein